MSTEPNGEFFFATSPGTKAKFGIQSSEGVAPSVLDFQIGDGETIQYLDFVLQNGTKVFGHVLDVNGKPFKGFPLFITDANDVEPKLTWTTGIGDDGGFEIILPPGTYTLESLGEKRSIQIAGDQESLELKIALGRDIDHELSVLSQYGEFVAIAPSDGTLCPECEARNEDAVTQHAE